MSYIDFVNVKKCFPIHHHLIGGNFLYAVNGLNLQILKGEAFGLVGESGSGKSTVAKMLVGILKPTSGKITIDGMDLYSLGKGARKEYHKLVSIVFQNPFSSLNPKMSVFSIIAEPLANLQKLTRAQCSERVIDLLQQVGLSSHQHMYRYPHQFSGGQRQRIAIARAISFYPSVLILDEPTSALDVSVQAKIINLLSKLRSSYNFTYVFISHNIGVIRHISDRIGVMYQGRLLEVGSGESITRNPFHPYSRYLISSIPGTKREYGEAYQDTPISTEGMQFQSRGCPFAAKCPVKLPVCSEEFPNRVDLDTNHFVYCHLSSE